jgi:hypothetical protein
MLWHSKKNVKLSNYRPGRPLVFQISRQMAHECGKAVSPTHRPPLPPKKYSWYSSQLEAKSTPRIISKEGLNRWKTPTPSEIEPATFRLVAQCLNQLRHRVPPQKHKVTVKRARKQLYLKPSLNFHPHFVFHLHGQFSTTHSLHTAPTPIFALGPDPVHSSDCNTILAAHYFSKLHLKTERKKPHRSVLNN